MPELPELEAISQYLSKILLKRAIINVETFKHTVIRSPSPNQFTILLKDASLEQIDRIGRIMRFLFTKSNSILHLYIDHGLTGRLTFKDLLKKIPKKTVLSLDFDNDKTLIYYDSRLHGAIWLYTGKKDEKVDYPSVIDRYGPGIMQITEEEFIKRIKKYRGEIKGVLTNQGFVSGIGNAYSDEILFEAKIHPFSKRTDLEEAEIKKLFQTCQNVLSRATSSIFKMLSETGEFNENKWRENILKVHLKGEEPCPECGYRLSTIKSRRLTNYCRKCQPSKNRNFI